MTILGQKDPKLDSGSRGKVSEENRQEKTALQLIANPHIDNECKSRFCLTQGLPFSSSLVSTSVSMEYPWLEPRHDPIVTDSHLAEIDFEDFRNEDLAYAFSCGDEDSGGSSTDMSICRSEVLFSSIHASSNAMAAGTETEGIRDSYLKDSLLGETGEFALSDQIKANKNNYTLTFSGHATASLYASMSASANFQAQQLALKTSKSKIDGKESSVRPLFQRNSSSHDAEIPGKFTTWSHLGSYKSSSPQTLQRKDSMGSRSQINEENNNGTNTRQDGDQVLGNEVDTVDSSPSESNRLVNVFMKNRDFSRDVSQSTGDGFSTEDTSSSPIPTMRSKDTVNQYLKTASKLASIEENRGGDAVAHLTIRAARDSRNGDCDQLKSTLPELDFLQNDVALWDAFFLHSKNAARFRSVLKQNLPPVPLEEYLAIDEHMRRDDNKYPQSFHKVASSARRKFVPDIDSLRMLLPESQKYLLPEPSLQVQDKMEDQDNALKSSNTHDLQNEALKSHFHGYAEPHGDKNDIEIVKVKEAWAPLPEMEPAVVIRRKKNQENAINNNEELTDKCKSTCSATKRRSYNPQDHLSQLLNQPTPTSPSNPGRMSRLRRRASRPTEFPKSGSQNDLCDAWTPEELKEGGMVDQRLAAHQRDGQGINPSPGKSQSGPCCNPSAEYPFQMNLCMPPQGINFDLTRKRDLFVRLYSAVEKLLMYQDGDSATSSTISTSQNATQGQPLAVDDHHSLASSASIRCIVFYELCPALYAILEDGLKAEVITSFGRMQTTVWRVIEAITRQGPAAQTTCDLVMLLNTRFNTNEDQRKFAGFVTGLLNMSSLHIWFAKLKWSMDVLLRFYERHAFICGLHRETRLLFDELHFCLQRLYCIPFRIELPFSSDILEGNSYVNTDAKHNCCPARNVQLYSTSTEQALQCRSCCSSSETNTYTYDDMSSLCSGKTPTTPSLEDSPSSASSRIKKSRIPRPISLPKRLEAKLGSSSSPVRSKKTKEPNVALLTKPPATGTRKSRVKDAVKLFDSTAWSPSAKKPPSGSAANKINKRSSSKKTFHSGAGESMAKFPSSEG